MELAAQARRIWRGLHTLGTVSSCRGYVCRSVLPRDNRTHYPNSSGDQYTLFCAGLYRYYRSGLATGQDRRAIAAIAADICAHVLNADMNIMLSDDKDLIGSVGDRAKQILTSMPSERLLLACSLYNMETIFWRGRECGLW